MEVVVPSVEFNFDSACNTPYASAPSSPRGLGPYYTSAPTSPDSAAAIYDHFRAGRTASSSINPFNWEEETTSTAATDKNDRHHEGGGENKSVIDGDDFAFEFSDQLAMGSGEPVTATADELFEAGKIRPLKPPPRVQVAELIDQGGSHALWPKSPKSPKSAMSRMFRRRSDEDDLDPFVKATEETIRGREPLANGGVRGSRRAARSLSPFRGLSSVVTATSTTTTNTTTVATAKIGSKKWRLKDFFLFRSASEGRVTGNRRKDPLRKYTAAVADNDVKNSSFRSTDSGSGSMRRAFPREDSGSVGGSSRRVLGRDDGGSIGRSSRRAVSAHEVHYSANRAASEEMRRKTFLPYRQGLLGCLGFNPSMDGFGKAFGTIAGGHRRRWT